MANAPDSESEDWGFDSLCGNNKIKFSSGRMANASVFEADTLTGLQVRVLWGELFYKFFDIINIFSNIALNKKMKQENIIYGLYCPIRNKPVYVGQTINGLDRPFLHIHERSHSKKVNEWVSELKKNGLSPVIVILERTDNADSLDDKERFWVQKFLNDGNLLLNQKLVSPNFFTVAEFSEEGEFSFNEKLRLFVKGRRKILNLTQEKLSQKSGVGLRLVRKIEQQNSKQNFNTVSVNKLLYCLGAKLSVINYRDE